MFQDLVGCQRRALARDDGEADAFAEAAVRDRECGCLEHAGVLQRHALDAPGVDVVAAADDEVLLASHDLQVAVGVEASQITAHEPAAGVERILGRDLVVEITEHEQRTAGADFADLPRLRLHVRILLIEEAGFVAVARLAAGGRDDLRIVVRERVLVRTVFGHAVDVLRLDSHREERLRGFRRDDRSRHVEEAHLAQSLEAAPFHVREDVDRVRRHAHHVGGAGRDDPVERFHPRWRIVHDEFKACHEALLERHRRDVMRQRAVGQKHGAPIVAPVLHHRAAVGEQRVVRVQHALRRAGRPGREREVDDLVGTGIRIRKRAFKGHVPDRGKGSVSVRSLLFIICRSELIDPFHARDRPRCREHVLPTRVRAMAALRKERSRMYAFQQLNDFRHSVILMQRRIAHVAVARAGEHDDYRLHPVGKPHRNALTPPQSRLVEVGCERVHPRTQLRPCQTVAAVAQRAGRPPLGCVPREQRVHRVLAPEARLVMPARSLRIVQSEYRAQ